MRLAAQVLLSVAICMLLLTPTLVCALAGGNYVPLIVCGVFAVVALALLLVAFLHRRCLLEEDCASSPQPGGLRAVAASDALPRVPWYCRFYRFLTDSGVMFVEFPNESALRHYRRRCIWRFVALLVFLALFVFLLWWRIGLLVLLFPFLIPIAAFFLYGFFALDFIPERCEPSGGETASVRCRVSTGRPFRAFAVTYCIIYALFLLSTPFRPLPLDPPPPELMAKIHPCLLDENGNLRKRQIVVVEGIQSYKDIECVITNGTHKEFAVVGTMLSQGFSTQYKEFANEVRDLEQSAKTNLLASVVFENQKGLEDWLGRVTETMNDAKTNAMPQLGYQSIVPDFAVARGEHIRRLLGFLPNIIPFSPGFKALSSLCVDSGNEQKIQDVLGLLSVYLDAMLCGDNNSTYTMYAGIFRRIAVSLIVRFAENADIANDVPPSIETAFCSGGTSLYEKGLWDSYNDFAGCSMTTVDYFLPMSGTSLPKALGELSRRQPRSIGRFFGKEDEVRSRVPIFVNTALWCPILAFLDGYDTSAQMSYLKRGEDWKAILLTKALDADELACDEILNAGTKHPFGRGGLLFGVDHQFGLTMFPNIKPRLLQARYADRYDLVVSAALRLEQFRGEKGRDAASLDEVEEALSWKRNKTDGDIEVVYRPVTPPEGAAEGTFAYVIGLKPKDGCRKAFGNTGVAWLVVRNPNFPGTLKRRFMTFERYKGTGSNVKPLSWDLRIGDEDGKDDPFVLPSAFFGDDPAALEEAVKTMKKRGWAL